MTALCIYRTFDHPEMYGEVLESPQTALAVEDSEAGKDNNGGPVVAKQY